MHVSYFCSPPKAFGILAGPPDCVAVGEAALTNVSAVLLAISTPAWTTPLPASFTTPTNSETTCPGIPPKSAILYIQYITKEIT